MTVACAAVLCVSAAACADEYVDRVNALYEQIQPNRRSDEVLLPLLAKMAPPPAGVDRPIAAALRPPTGAVWGEARAWAADPAQQALIRALDRVTSVEDYRTAFAFGQAYGAEGVPIDQVRRGLYTELGDPPLLAGAKFGDMPKLRDLACLVQVEATRLQSEGDPAGALDVLGDWVFFARQMMDRAFASEARFGYEQLGLGLHRIRDVVRVDDAGAKQITPDQLASVIERLDPRRGFLGLDRLTLPQGDRIAAEQLLNRVLAKGGGVNRATFAPTMASLNAGDRPLRLFGEASTWDSAAATQSDYATTREALRSLYGDWEARWVADPYSTLLGLEPESATVLADPRLTVLSTVLARGRGSPDDLFDLRDVVRTEIVGTRDALAIVAYTRNFRSFPRVIESVRPQWIDRIEADPYNPDRAHGKVPPLQYFVPERDTNGPHEILIVSTGSEDFPTFRKPLYREDFVLYSFGPDRTKDWAKEVENSVNAARGRDYLLWPPLLSLAREYLVEQGALE